MGSATDPVVLTVREEVQLIQAPDRDNPSHLRDIFMMKVMVHAGLKPGEICSLRREHLDCEARTLRVVDSLGDLDRVLALDELPTEPWKDLNEWERSQRSRLPEGMRESSYLFATHRGTSVSRRHLRRKITDYAEHAGISKEITPSTLRHTFAVTYYRATKDIEELGVLLGIRDPYYLRQYKRIVEEDSDLRY